MLSRRRFLAIAVAAFASFLAACAAAIPSSARPPPSSPSARPPNPSPSPSRTPTPTPVAPLRERIGQMVVVGFRGRTAAEAGPAFADVAAGRIGGVVLFSRDQLTGEPRNIQSPEQLATLTADLQAASARWPLLISVDQEGGQVARLGPAFGFPATRSAEELGALDDLSMTRAQASSIAATLVAAGINLNLAPAVDLAVNPTNPIIAEVGRSFGADPARVIAHATAFIEAHHDAGVKCTLKHFPGHGSSTGDTHLGVVDVTDTWSEVELEPFAALIGAGITDAVLTAHVFNRTLDPDHPATLSRPTVGGILRGDLGFDGAVLSDDLQMGAIRDAYGFEEALALAIEAGIDLLVVANQLVYEPDVAARMVDLVEGFVTSGRIAESRIDESVERIGRLRN